MAAIALANIAAATAAGYSLERYTLPSGLPGTTGGQFVTRLAKKATGIQGQSGAFVQWTGESGVSAAAADTAALTNLNRWRDNRYGPDSAAASLSPTADAVNAGSQGPGTAPVHRAMTKDRD